MIVVMVIVLVLAAVALGRRGFWTAGAVCWVLVGVVLAGAESPVATLARVCANAVIDGGTAFVASLGEAL